MPRKLYRRYRRIEEGAWSLTFGVIFIVWGVLCAVYPWFPGSPWIAFGGIILLAHVGIEVWRSSTIKKLVLGALLSRKGETVEIASLTKELGVSEEILKEALVDLRSEGKIMFTLDEEAKQIRLK